MITAPRIAAVVVAWLAFGGVAGATATDRFDPSFEQQLVGFEDVDFDSGWLPPNAPVQLRLYAHAADSISIEMLGEATYDWDAETIALAGDPQAGLFAIDVGLQLQASVRFDVAGFSWESDILGPWDYAIISDALFTPYLLPGNPDRPVQIEDHADGSTIASVPVVPDILIASGNLDLDVAADITATLQGVRIEATTPEDGAIIDQEGVPSPLSPLPGADPLMVEGVMVTNLQTAPVLIVRPHLVMSILGVDYEIAGLDIPITLPEIDQQQVFEPEPMVFAAPEPPPALDTSGEGGQDESGGDPPSTTSTGQSIEDGDGTETDAPGMSESGDVGCGCHHADPPPLPGVLSLLWVLALLRTRRW